VAFENYHEDASVANDFNAASGSFAYTVNANAERFLLVRIGIANGVTVSGVTYNGVNLTLIGRSQNGTNCDSEMWGLKNPASGSNTLAWTLTGSEKHVVAATGMSGINQTVPYRNFTGAIGNSAGASVTVPNTTNEHKVMDGVCSLDGPGGIVVTEGAGQTKQYEDRTTGGAANSNAVGFGSVENGGGSVVMSWTWGPVRQWSSCGVEILPVVVGELDITGIALIVINGSFIGSGAAAFAAVGTMTAAGGRVRLGVMATTAIAAMTCFPEFPEADVNLPVAVPQQFFFFNTANEFLLRWVLQETNRPKRIDLGKFLSVTLKIDGFPDKECVIEDANDGVVRYITSPGEFPVGRYKGHLTMILDGNFDSSAPESDEAPVYEVEVDSPEFIVWVQEPPS
jgi:hypothetical protein